MPTILHEYKFPFLKYSSEKKVDIDIRCPHRNISNIVKSTKTDAADMKIDENTVACIMLLEWVKKKDTKLAYEKYILLLTTDVRP